MPATITLNLTIDQETLLEQQAKQCNLPIEEFALARIFGEALAFDAPVVPKENIDNWQRLFDEHVAWIASVVNPEAEEISLEEMSRKNLYADHGKVRG